MDIAIVIKTLKQFLLVSAFVMLASAATFAQRQNDQNKPPPKKDPPQVVVPKQDKKPKEDKPRGDGRKRPGLAFGLVQGKETLD
jgi:hypothetical protein